MFETLRSNQSCVAFRGTAGFLFVAKRFALVKPAFLAHARQEGRKRFYDFGTGGRTIPFPPSVALPNATPGTTGMATGTRGLSRST